MEPWHAAPSTQPPTCSPQLTFVDVAKNVQSWLDPPLHRVQQLHTPHPLHLLGDPVQEACGTDRRVSGTGRAQPKLRQSPVLSTYWGWKDGQVGGGQPPSLAPLAEPQRTSGDGQRGDRNTVDTGRAAKERSRYGEF